MTQFTVRYTTPSGDQVHEKTPHPTWDDAFARRCWLINNGVSKAGVAPEIVEEG